MFALNAPHSPLSAVTITSRRRPVVRRASSGCASSPARVTRLERSSAIFCAYGLASVMRSWARRSLAAATSFMARVIFWVDWTERIRRRMSRRVAMVRGGSGRLATPRCHEYRLGVTQRLAKAVAQLVGQLLLARHVGEDLRVLALQERIQELLEGPDLIHRDVVEDALPSR